MRIPVETQGGAATRHVIDLRPSKIVCVGQNYRAHAAEMGKPVPAEPVLFLKAPSAMIAPGEPIPRSRALSRVDYEGELAFVVARRTRRVRAADALDHVLGFCCVNDVTARELQARDGQWARAKSFDGFCPVGPRIVAGLDPSDLALRTRVNGEVRQDSRTSDLIFPVPFLIEYISACMTLEPGDLVSTGTPSGVGNLAAGDTVVVDIEGIGALENPVADDEGDVSA
ncbi:MAG TPA: fumarylacetoacetate hydrolase family protein [Kofleriaceae bacterium]|nr:fumarylacetoacetate hydrolase family protein [Kofleriaceae bacterium]